MPLEVVKLDEATAGDDIVVIDTAAAVARQVERQFAAAGLDPEAGVGRQRFFTTGDAASYRTVLQRLWPGAGPAQALPDGSST